MQLTEALAEFWHARIRSELGFAGEDPADTAGLFKLEYRGARFSLGYPACPEMEDRRKVVELLRPERMGVELSEERAAPRAVDRRVRVPPPPRGEVRLGLTPLALGSLSLAPRPWSLSLAGGEWRVCTGVTRMLPQGSDPRLPRGSGVHGSPAASGGCAGL